MHFSFVFNTLNFRNRIVRVKLQLQFDISGVVKVLILALSRAKKKEWIFGRHVMVAEWMQHSAVLIVVKNSNTGQKESGLDSWAHPFWHFADGVS